MDLRAPSARRRALYPGGHLGLRALLLVAGLLPWLFALARARPPTLILVFRTLCHQRPERTLAVLGAPMLVCSRCAGLYAGVALGALLALPRRALPHGRAIVLAAVAVALVDIVTQDLGLHPPLHPVRLGTGLLLGWSASAWTFSLLREESSRGR
jgi:uncharacterized membrane protein